MQPSISQDANPPSFLWKSMGGSKMYWWEGIYRLFFFLQVPPPWWQNRRTFRSLFVLHSGNSVASVVLRIGVNDGSVASSLKSNLLEGQNATALAGKFIASLGVRVEHGEVGDDDRHGQSDRQHAHNSAQTTNQSTQVRVRRHITIPVIYFIFFHSLLFIYTLTRLWSSSRSPTTSLVGLS